LNLAIAANVGYLVSRDKDLLDLMMDQTFVGKFPQLRVVEPVAFLQAVRAGHTA
jgi:predicted nucleic acid-binding protein